MANWVKIDKGVQLDWDTETDEAKVLFNEDEAVIDSVEIPSLIESLLGRKCEIYDHSWDSVNEGQGEVINTIHWKGLTAAQRFEILSLVEPTAQAFVDEFKEPLEGSETDWDGVAWSESDRLKFSFEENDEICDLACEFYLPELERATTYLCG